MELEELYDGLKEITRQHFDSSGDPFNLSHLEYTILCEAQKILLDLRISHKYPELNVKLATGGLKRLRRR